MMILMLVFSAFFALISGYFTLNIFLNSPDDVSPFERLPLGYMLGLMLITCWMFFGLTKLHIPFSVASICIPLSVIAAVGVLVSIKRAIPLPKLTFVRDLSSLDFALIAVIFIQIFFVFTSVMIKPVSGWDAWQVYSVNAKAYFMERTAEVPSIAKTIRGQFGSLSQTWVFVCTGQWNEILGKLNYPLLFAAAVALFYFALRRSSRRTPALFATSVITTMPFLAYHATIEYNDIIIGYYLFCAVVLMMRWFEKRDVGLLAAFLFFLISTVTIKNESGLHIVIAMTVFIGTIMTARFNDLSYIKQLRGTMISGAAAAVIYLILTGANLSRAGVSLSRGLDLSRVPKLLGVFADYMFVRDNFGIVWFALIILIAINWRRLREDYYLSLLSFVALEVVCWVGFYLVAVVDIFSWLFFVTPAVRNMLQFMPVTVLLLGRTLDINSGPPIAKPAGKK